MGAIVSVIIIFMLLAITFLQSIKKEGRKNKGRVGYSELDYLYAYKNVLLRVMQVEEDLDSIMVPIDRYTQNAHAYFSPIEILHIKQGIANNIKKLIADYQQGLISNAAAHKQLDEISKRMHVLFFQMAA